MSVRVNLTKFDRAFNQACYLTFFRLGQLFQEQLTEERREYPRITFRKVGTGKTGKVADSPRDVVDTGALVSSFFWEMTVTGKIYKGAFHWDAPHAALVYLGWVSSTGTEVPEYPWVDLVLDEVDVREIFREAWQYVVGNS